MTNKHRTILALDMAECTGWAVRNEASVYYGHKQFTKPKPAAPTLGRLKSHSGERFAEMHVWFRRMLKLYNPTEIAIERPGGGSSRMSAELALGFRGVVLAVMAFYKLPEVLQVAPNTLKKYATGYGKAEKPAMLKACEEQILSRGTLINEQPCTPTHDEVDAIWIAEWAWKESHNNKDSRESR